MLSCGGTGGHVYPALAVAEAVVQHRPDIRLLFVGTVGGFERPLVAQSSVLYHYDQLAAINPSPIVALNRAVAVAMVHGPQAGLRALDQIEGLGNYYLLLATYGELAERCGEPEEAASYYRRALAGAANHVERDFLQKKLARVGGR